MTQNCVASVTNKQTNKQEGQVIRQLTGDYEIGLDFYALVR